MLKKIANKISLFGVSLLCQIQILHPQQITRKSSLTRSFIWHCSDAEYSPTGTTTIIAWYSVAFFQNIQLIDEYFMSTRVLYKRPIHLVLLTSSLTRFPPVPSTITIATADTGPGNSHFFVRLKTSYLKWPKSTKAIAKTFFLTRSTSSFRWHQSLFCGT